jgi:hypothetical protein
MRIFWLSVFFLMSRSLMGQDNPVRFLGNENIVVGILPEIGGRIVYFGTKNGVNILKAVPALWNDSGAEKPGINEVSDYKAYHGHIIWPSPMSEWWSKQTVYPEKRKDKSRWPPDPYIIYGEYTVITEDAKSITWQSPPSPISGIQITQRMDLQEDNRMIYQVQFTNVTDSAIHWGIWFNTRLDGRAHCFVKAASENSLYIKKNDGNIVPWEFAGGYFTFLPEKVTDTSEKIYAKACIDAESNMIAAFAENQLIVIETPQIDRLKVHSDHRFVEIYNQLMPNPADDLLELEFHTEYTKIEPGASITAFQIWRAYDTSGIHKREDQISFLEQVLANLE